MIGAVIGSVVGGLLASKAQKSAARTAANAQVRSTELSIEEQRRQFDAMKELLAPYVNAGIPALQEMAEYAEIGPRSLDKQTAILGLDGPEAQAQAIAELESSPLFQSQIAQGEDAILQNASATGGLRGGNTQGALALFRPAMLRDEIERQYSKLGSLTNFGSGMTQNLATLGQASAAGQGAAGMNMANNVGNALMASGDAQAQAALAGGRASAQMYGDIADSVSQIAAMKAMGVI